MTFYRTTLDYLRVPSGCPITSYYWSGFSTLQASIDHTWLGWKDSRHATPSVGLQLLPMIEFTSSNALVLRSIVPLYLVISLSQFITPMLMVVVDEKEKKIKESMRMVGLRDSVFWLSWFVVYAAMVLLISIVATILTATVLIPSVNVTILFVMVLLFGLSIIMFAFMLTSMFSKAKVGFTHDTKAQFDHFF